MVLGRLKAHQGRDVQRDVWFESRLRIVPGSTSRGTCVMEGRYIGGGSCAMAGRYVGSRVLRAAAGTRATGSLWWRAASSGRRHISALVHGAGTLGIWSRGQARAGSILIWWEARQDESG